MFNINNKSQVVAALVGQVLTIKRIHNSLTIINKSLDSDEPDLDKIKLIVKVAMAYIDDSYENIKDHSLVDIVRAGDNLIGTLNSELN